MGRLEEGRTGNQEDQEIADEAKIQELLDAISSFTKPKRTKERAGQVLNRVVYATRTRTTIHITEDGTRYAFRYHPRGADKDKSERRLASPFGSGPEQGLMATIHIVPDYNAEVKLSETPASYFKIVRVPQTGRLRMDYELLLPLSDQDIELTNPKEIVTLADLLYPTGLKQLGLEDKNFRRQTGVDLVTKGDINGILTAIASPRKPDAPKF